jgi:beta-lactam-binding protein with PASTA domain
LFFDRRSGNSDEVTDDRPVERLDDTGWPGFSPDEVRAQEELLDERGAATVEPQVQPPGSTAARRVATLGILALLALLGAAAALLVLGAGDPSSGSAASREGPVTPGGGGNGAQQPPASAQLGSVATTDSATTTDTTTDAVARNASTTPVAVPDVVGEQASQATQRLRDADLHPKTRLVASSRAAGTVVDQAPSAGERLASGGIVTLDVAKPRPVVTVRVPRLVAMTVTQAKQALRSAALSWSVTTVSSSKPAGTVLGQSPAAGAKVRRGSAVTLRVSAEPALATVPDVTGLDEGEARVALQGDGFQVAVVDQPTDDSTQDGVVVDQSPSGSTEAREGSTVTITVARFA